MFAERKIQAPFPRVNTLVHIGRVYGLLVVGVLVSALGTYADIHYVRMGGFGTGLLGAVLFGVARTMRGGSNGDWSGHAVFLTATALQGISVSPLVHTAMVFYPDELMAAATMAMCAFMSFSVVGLTVWHSNKIVYLLMAAVSTIGTFWFATWVLNIFLRKSLMFELHVLTGLLLLVGYIVVDTAVMIRRIDEVVSYGGKVNYVRPACDLFSDLFGLFVRSLLLLIRKAKQRGTYSSYQNSIPQPERYYKRVVRSE